MNHDLLVRNCLKQKPEAQKRLYDHFAPSMLGVCYRYTKSREDAENVLQEGFIKVFKNLKRYRGEGDLGAWIRKIMVNTALNYLKTHRRYREHLVFEDQILHPVSSDNPEIRLHAEDLVRLIRQLPHGYQTIFNLYAVEGYSHGEIAVMLGIREGTSRSQYARARGLLIEWIEKISSNETRESHGK